MLRITRKANGGVVFKVSGQLTAENVAQMEALFAEETKGRRIVLDCTDLRSVDGEAVKFLERWEADSIKLKNSAFTSESGSGESGWKKNRIRVRINERPAGPTALSLCSKKTVMARLTNLGRLMAAEARV